MIHGREIYNVVFEDYISAEDAAKNNNEMKIERKEIEWMVLARRYLHERVAKKFGKESFEGSVTDVIPPAENDHNTTLFTIFYEKDSDFEDMNEKEVKVGMSYFAALNAEKEKEESSRKRKLSTVQRSNGKVPPMEKSFQQDIVSHSSTGPRRSHRVRKSMNYKEAEDIYNEEDPIHKTNRKRAKNSKVSADGSDVSMEDYEGEDLSDIEMEYDSVSDEEPNKGAEQSKVGNRKPQGMKSNTSIPKKGKKMSDSFTVRFAYLVRSFFFCRQLPFFSHL